VRSDRQVQSHNGCGQNANERHDDHQYDLGLKRG
jgi:hypothetical protein